MQNELATSSSNEDKTQLEGELVTIEKEIISAVANIESFERRIQYFEGKLQEERDLEKEKHRKKGEEIIYAYKLAVDIDLIMHLRLLLLYIIANCAQTLLTCTYQSDGIYQFVYKQIDPSLIEWFCVHHICLEKSCKACIVISQLI